MQIPMEVTVAFIVQEVRATAHFLSLSIGKKKKVWIWDNLEIKEGIWFLRIMLKLCTLQQDCNIIVTLDYKVKERFVVRLQNKHAAFMFIV